MYLILAGGGRLAWCCLSPFVNTLEDILKVGFLGCRKLLGMACDQREDEVKSGSRNGRI